MAAARMKEGAGELLGQEGSDVGPVTPELSRPRKLSRTMALVACGHSTIV
jgi:hypothetical protein